MEHPSQEWLDKFNETLVPESFVEIAYDSTEPGLQEDATASASSQVKFGNVSNITKDFDRKLTKYATGETNLHVLDGSFSIVPDSVPYKDAGFVSQTLVSETSHPRIVISFSKVHTRAIPGLTIIWSSLFNEWATKFKLTAYKDTTVVGTTTVTDNEKVRGEVEWEIYNYDSIAIDILEWCIPNRRARLEWVMLGFHNVYNKKDLISYTHTSSRDPVSGQLSKDSIEFSLDNSQKTWDAINPRGMFRYLYERQEVNVRYGMDVDGETQWINGGTFYLSEWNIPSNGMEASFVARDALAFMMNSTYTGRKVGTLYQMCYDALEMLPSNVPSFYISEELKEYSTDISSGNDSYKNSDILQLAANAAGMALYQTRDGHIRIERVNMAFDGTTEVYEIPVINNYKYPEISYAARVKNVSCKIGNTEHLYPEGSTSDGVTQTVSNKLLTESILSKSKNSVTEAYAMLANRRKCELEYRASPHIDAFDHVKLMHNFGYASNVFVTESKYQYNGYFSGTLSGYILADVSSVSLSPNSLDLIYNESQVLTASLLPYDPDLPTISWKASPEGVVALHVLTNQSGKSTCEVKYVKKGKATVTAYVGSTSTSVPVVNNSPSLHLNKSSLDIRWGVPQELKATFTPNNYGAPQIAWSASPADIVKLEVTQNSAGVSVCRVSWLKKGKATITATAAEERATCSVTTLASTLGSLPEGTILSIAKGTGTVKVALVKHDYEKTYNGAGRNLMLQMERKDSRIWNEYSSNGISDNYKDSAINTWLNNTWVNNFSTAIRDKMGETAFLSYTTFSYRDQDGMTTYKDSYGMMKQKAFLLSAAEVGIYPNYSLDNGVPKEGTKLPDIERILFRALNSSINAMWTRTRLDYDKSNRYSDWSVNYPQDRNQIFVVSSFSEDEYGSAYTSVGDVLRVTDKMWVVPAFTLPNTLEVDSNGLIMI